MTSGDFEVAREQLTTQLVHLHDMWDQYTMLFSHSEDRVRMLNGCAGWFFYVTHRALLRETVLGISRLTDSPKGNLTIAILLRDPALQGLPNVRSELEQAIQAVHTSAAKLRTHRNKVLAHLDLATATRIAKALPTVLREEITEAIQLLVRAYNVHNHGVHDTEMFFDVLGSGDANELVRVLEESPKWAEVRGGRVHD